MYVCVCVHAFVRACVVVPIRMHAGVFVTVYNTPIFSMYLCMCVYVCIYMYMHACMHAFIHACMYVTLCTRT